MDFLFLFQSYSVDLACVQMRSEGHVGLQVSTAEPDVGTPVRYCFFISISCVLTARYCSQYLVVKTQEIDLVHLSCT